MVPLLREGAARVLFHVRLFLVLGPDPERLDWDCHGRIRSAHEYQAEDSHPRGGQRRLLRDRGRRAPEPALKRPPTPPCAAVAAPTVAKIPIVISPRVPAGAPRQGSRGHVPGWATVRVQPILLKNCSKLG